MAIVAIFAIGLSLGGAITRDEITDSDQVCICIVITGVLITPGWYHLLIEECLS